MGAARRLTHLLVALTIVQFGVGVRAYCHVWRGRARRACVILQTLIGRIKMIGDVELSFRQAPMPPHLHKLSVTSTIVSEHAYCQQYQEYEDEPASNGDGYHGGLEPQVTLHKVRAIHVW